MDDAQHTLEHLIRFASPSEVSNEAVTHWVEARLRELGFATEVTCYLDRHGVQKFNVVGYRHPGDAAQAPPSAAAGAGGLAYFAHTDVVPADVWEGPGGPYDPQVSDGRLYGRGSCDMKGSLAAMLAAVRRVAQHDQQTPIWVACTADEEIGFGGAKHLRQESEYFRRLVEAQPRGIVGEPTRMRVVHAHKGITGFTLKSLGRAAHSSTRAGLNAYRAMVPVLQELLEIDELTRSDATLQDERFDPPTLSWNFGVSAGASAINVTPGKATAWGSLRPMPSVDGLALIERVRHAAHRCGVQFETYEGGDPLWCEPDDAWVQQMCEWMGSATPLTASYCTDAGQFTELEALVVCGPGDIAQAHTTDEFIELEQLALGVDLYERVLRAVCC